MNIQLPRIRLLPVTMAAILALLLVKSVLLVQAIAGEASPSAKAAETAAGDQGASRPAPAVQPAPVAPVAKVAAQAASGTPAVQSSQPPDTPADTAQVSDAERAVLLDLRQRHEALENRAKELDQRAAELAAADRRLNDRVQQLAALQTRLEALEAARQQHKAENWAGLVKIYESMKPRDAAAILDALDMQVLLQVLDRMADRKAAPVLAAMQPDRARLATQLLAEMRTRAITPPPPAPAYPAQASPARNTPDPKG